MVRHGSPLKPENDLPAVIEPIATDPIDTTPPPGGLQTQLHSSQRLNEYYNQVVAELRASLAEIGEEVDGAT